MGSLFRAIVSYSKEITSHYPIRNKIKANLVDI